MQFNVQKPLSSLKHWYNLDNIGECAAAAELEGGFCRTAGQIAKTALIQTLNLIFFRVRSQSG